MERRASARRRPVPGSSSPQSTPEDRLPSPASPLAASSTPQTAGRRGSKQPNNNNNTKDNSFTLSSPNANRSLSGTKRRSRTMDGFAFGDEYLEDGSPIKGGHSLRKRTRVSYYNIENSTEDVDDEPAAPSSSSASARSRKRKSDIADLPETLQSHPPKKRGNSLGAAEGLTTRRTSARKNADAKSYQEDEDVKDTIEVGGTAVSDLEEAESRPLVNGPEDEADRVDIPQDQATVLKSDEKLDTTEPSISTGSQVAISLETERRADVPTAVSFTETVMNSPREPFQDLSTFSWPDSQAEDVRRSPQVQGNICHDSVAVASETQFQQAEVTESQRSEADVPETTKVQEATDVQEAAEMQDATKVQEPTEANEATESQEATEAQQATEAQGTEGLQATEAQDTESQETEAKEASNSQHVQPETVEPALQHADPPAEKVVDSQTHLAPEPPHTDASQGNAAEDNRASAEPSAVDSSDPPATEAADPNRDTVNADTTADAAFEANRPGRTPAQTDDRRSAHLTAYVEGEYQTYPLPPQPKRRPRDESFETPAQRAALSLAKDASYDSAADAQGSPVLDSAAATAANSPAVAPAEENAEDASGAEERAAVCRYRKLQNPAVYAAALQNYQQMSTEELCKVLNTINVAMQEWQTEHRCLARMVQDHDNAKRRQEADAKYENKTRDLSIPGPHHEEPDFVVRKYGRKSKGDKENKDGRDKDRDKGAEAELRWLQSQDRIMAQSFYFAYDPHVSKIGRQDMENRNVEGAAGHQRSLRGQPKQTQKACEAGKEEMGKRTRKPVQHFDPAPKQPSRSTTPALVKAGKKKANNALAVAAASAAAAESRQKAATTTTTTTTAGKKRAASSPEVEELEAPRKGPKRRRGAQNRPQDADTEEDPTPTLKTEKEKPMKTEEAPPKRHVLTLKVPKTKMVSGPSSGETDKDESRPSTASSESSSHTIESSYSFRPNRQKRFRDEPEDQEAKENQPAQQPPKKRSKRAVAPQAPPQEEAEPGPAPTTKGKVSKIKVVSKSGAGAKSNGTAPAPAEAEEHPPKDYKSMTKSEKMSASMKSRWANGNMAGAVEKRKATLAAKKAAAAAGDSKAGGGTAPKTAKAKSTKEKTATQQQQPQSEQQQQQGHENQHGNGKGKGSSTFPACAPN
ncbi:hypothetical protein CP532_6477 [Ophiocordyceps camponoti-leonardi (nom. inval.)]|nr:hypothetical protein CP532_6477 [Ophiocordyceps camponoti-leonardi (nom. inval.)]